MSSIFNVMVCFIFVLWGGANPQHPPPISTPPYIGNTYIAALYNYYFRTRSGRVKITRTFFAHTVTISSENGLSLKRANFHPYNWSFPRSSIASYAKTANISHARWPYNENPIVRFKRKEYLITIGIIDIPKILRICMYYKGGRIEEGVAKYMRL